jgi:hypothetical protein
MTGTLITVAGIEIPSTDPAFLVVVAVHVLFGLACTITGITAMLSPKRRGRHPWVRHDLLLVSDGSIRNCEALWLQSVGPKTITCSFSERWPLRPAHLGRMARRKRWSNWVKLHITGMGTSYILLLTAFYVDNGKNLPLWRDLPPVVYWLVPAVVGIPLIVRALLWPPLARTSQPPSPL